MSEPPTGPGREQPASPERVHAGVRHGWWPGWIWAIPIAALLLVSWLGARALLAGGTDITIRFNDAHEVKKENTDVVLRGAQIGHVTDVKLNDKGTAVIVTASIDKEAAKFLRTGTRFWLQGANPSLTDLASLASVLSGPTIVMEPGAGPEASSFLGLEQQPIAPSTSERPLLYEVSLGSEAGSIAGGDPVTLRGFTVGEVRDVGFAYDPATGDISTPATLAIYPSLFHEKGARAQPNATEVSAEIALLVHKGMRARLARSPPLVGSYQMSLEIPPGARPPAGPLTAADGLPQIPLAEGGGIGSIVNRINRVPIEQISHNLLDATSHIAALTSSPKLKDAVAQLDAALRQIHGMTAKAGPQVPVVIERLRRAAADLDDTTQSADRLMSGTATQNGLADTIEEVNQTVRAIRSLADYLDRHPEALLREEEPSNDTPADPRAARPDTERVRLEPADALFRPRSGRAGRRGRGRRLGRTGQDRCGAHSAGPRSRLDRARRERQPAADLLPGPLGGGSRRDDPQGADAESRRPPACRHGDRARVARAAERPRSRGRHPDFSAAAGRSAARCRLDAAAGHPIQPGAAPLAAPHRRGRRLRARTGRRHERAARSARRRHGQGHTEIAGCPLSMI